jgi:phytanoyl-CoA hydroxylase
MQSECAELYPSFQVHYDQIFLRAGDPTFLTAWVPIGDVTPQGGALLYLEKSFDLGEEIEKEFAEKARDLTDEERISAFNANMMRGGMLSTDAGEFGKVYGRRWLVADYEDGDVVSNSLSWLLLQRVGITDRFSDRFSITRT